MRGIEGFALFGVQGVVISATVCAFAAMAYGAWVSGWYWWFAAIVSFAASVVCLGLLVGGALFLRETWYAAQDDWRRAKEANRAGR